MKLPLSILFVCVVAACGSSGGSQGPGGGGPANTVPLSNAPQSPTPAGSTNNVAFGGLLNNVRLANSAAPVVFDARLANAAQGHADDMLAQDYFSHTGRNGSSPGDRITAAGYNWRTYGENIAQGQSSQAQVLQAWTNSPGHHANNINPAFEDFGLAKAGSGSDARWVLVLAAEQ
ncbi:MAG: CAP domain-containing protein [Paracoccaceae bacterium]